MQKALYLLVMICLSSPLFAQVYKMQDPLAHTYSILARDSITGDLAVAVQSHWFSVGTAVSWGEAGVGVVATQSFVNTSFGIRGLALLKQGKSPQEALDELLSTDEGREVRQVAIMDAQGRVAAFTGANCIKYAGHITGSNFSVHANMMLNDKVWPAMAAAYQKNASMPLPERVLHAMQAGQAVGGDIRGKQSAAILVVKGKASNEPWNDRVMDLRVDDNPEPLKELARLIKVFRAYEHMNNGDLAVEKNDMKKAMQEYTAAEKMFPDNLEMQYWHAITLANNGSVDEAAGMLRKIYRKDDNWRLLTERLPASGLLTVNQAAFKKLTAKVK